MTFPSLISWQSLRCRLDGHGHGLHLILFPWPFWHLPLFHWYFLKYKWYDSSDTPGSGSSHKGMRGQIRKFTAAQMQASLDEIQFYQQWQQRLRLEKIKKSMNHITQNHGLSLATINKQITGKILGLGNQLGGAWGGKILTAGEFRVIWLPSLETSAWVSSPLPKLSFPCRIS